MVRNQLHPTQKPLDLFRYLTRVSSNVGDTVFDPCMGSGTTLVAAKLEGRNYLGYDISQEYVEITQKRIEETQLNNEV